MLCNIFIFLFCIWFLMPELVVDSVSKSYGSIRALRNVSFRVGDGEYFCILGPTGAGKTTLLKVISGLIRPDKGRVIIDGVDVTDFPPEVRNVSYMPQGYALFPHMTVWDNVAYGAGMKGLPEEKVADALKLVGLYHRRDSYPHELSGGQQQRIALARALAAGSKLLLLDEPLSALDILLNIELRYELKNLCRELDLTVLHVTHNVEEAMSIADRMMVLRKGVVQQIGSPREVYMNPANLFVANFLSEVNFIEGILRGIRLGLGVIETDKLGVIHVYTRPVRFWHVVVAYRPEDIVLSVDPPPTDLNVFRGRVVEREFIGIVTRFLVDVNGVEMHVNVWTSVAPDVKVDDYVYVHLPPRYGLIYPYPREGLMKAIAVE
ncbi:MAG: polyamine ABC transporter ATP-binding protein [Thermoprotei archaeon]|nr:MAG: polyamine ABC transporter ATP-binding protein [Thermoprotei archaeon]